jgi:integrase
LSSSCTVPITLPLPTERQEPPRYLSLSEVERLVDTLNIGALVLVGANRTAVGEAAGLRRRDIDPLRSRVGATSHGRRVTG